jgi:hypothetical protein
LFPFAGSVTVPDFKVAHLRLRLTHCAVHILAIGRTMSGTIGR